MRPLTSRTWQTLAVLSLAVFTSLSATQPTRAETKTQSSEEQLYLETLFEAARKYFPGSDERAKSAPQRIFRLTRDQIDATVHTLLPRHFASSVHAVMPKDPLQTNYEFADLLTINAANASALTAWIADLAERVRKSPAGVVDCAGKGDDCTARAVRRFVSKALRGDVDDAKIAKLVTFFDKSAKASSIASATGDLVEVVLNSPDFLFRKELDVDQRDRLTPSQLLQALTYIVADSPPDRLGFDSTDPAQYVGRGASPDALLARISATKEAREKLLRFFKAWLEIKDPADFTLSPMLYPEFTPKLAQAMVDETTLFLRAKLSAPAPKLKDITQAAETVMSAELAPLYAVAKPTAPGATVALDPKQRLGIFSQPAVLASHSGPDGTRPIKRGTFWLRKVMCMEMQPPPNGAVSTLPKAGGTTERKRIESVTNQPACAGCHRLIDPLGFFQESYDALGRFRVVENNQSIDPAVLLDFLDEGKSKPATSVEALKTLTGSMMFRQCFVRQMFRFYMGRNEDAHDDPMLRELYLNFERDDDILKLVQAFAANDRIVRRH